VAVSGQPAGHRTGSWRSWQTADRPQSSIDAIKVGDWLLHNGHMDVRRLEAFVELGLAEDVRAIGDLVYRKWHTVVKYEGVQHQDDRVQYTSDIDRYELFRDHNVSYVQVTKERLGKPPELVLKVDRTLRR
jgi:hypothetical protein